MSFGARMKNSQVLEIWFGGGNGRNHNGTFLAKANGELIYAGKTIACMLRDIETVYEVVLLNPEYATSPTMKKRIYQVLRHFKDMNILVCSDGAWEHEGVTI